MGMTVVVATGNQHKLEEISKIFEGTGVELKSMKDVGLGGMEIIEDGNTFEANALIKARAVMEKTGCLSLADDSGLEVDAIGLQPGIYSARFAGEGANDQRNNEKLLKLLENVPMEDRTGRFVCAMAAVFPDGREFIVRGTCEGMIATAPRGESGFGYDPLFIVPQYGKTFAQLGPEIKNKISHRAMALEKMKLLLQEAMEG